MYEDFWPSWLDEVSESVAVLMHSTSSLVEQEPDKVRPQTKFPRKPKQSRKKTSSKNRLSKSRHQVDEPSYNDANAASYEVTPTESARHAPRNYSTGSATSRMAGGRGTTKKVGRCSVVAGAMTLIVLSSVLTIAAIFVMGYIGMDMKVLTENKMADLGVVKKSPELCTTNACIIAAATLITSMNLTSDPCDDFHAFSCGNWKFKHPLASKEFTNGVEIIAEFVDAKVKDLLEQGNNKNDISSINKTRDFYRSCLSSETDRPLDGSGLLDHLASLPSFPALWAHAPRDPGEVNDHVINLVDNMVAAEKLGVRNFFYASSKAKPYANSDNNKPAHFSVKSLVKEGWQHMDGGYSDSRRYDMFIEYVSREMGVSSAAGLQQMKLTAKFSQQVHALYLKKSVTTIHMTRWYKNMSKSFPGFDWSRYVGQHLGNVNKTSGNQGMYLIDMDAKYLNDFLKLLNATPNSVIVNYINWKVWIYFRDFTKRDYYKRKTTWKKCLAETTQHFPWTIGRLFSSDSFSGNSKQLVTSMFFNIRSALMKVVDNCSWLSSKGKIAINAKLSDMKSSIGYPSFYEINANLEDHYKHVNIKADDYLNNMVSLNIATYLRTMETINEVKTREEWKKSAITINAQYEPSLNNVYIYAGFLQGITFNKEFPMYLNYASAGSTLGHEISHSIDDEGVKQDNLGNSVNILLSQDYSSYSNLSQCFNEQFRELSSSRRYGNIQVDVESTLSENIADSMGLRIARDAYTTLNLNDQQPLPGIDLTIDQLFYVQVAQEYCVDQVNSKHGNTATHMPFKIRLIGMIQNSKSFSEVFKCKPTDHMNKENKCIIW